ncbi:MAG: hypothetical protein AB7P21_25780 [Lautropia sp.]
MSNLQWNQLAVEAAEVIARRLWLVPVWWMTDPSRAQRETARMFVEKDAALRETQWLMVQAPLQYWADIWQGLLGGEIAGLHASAVRKAEHRIGRPALSRVSANRRRLARSRMF